MSFKENLSDYIKNSFRAEFCEFGDLLHMVEEKKTEAKKKYEDDLQSGKINPEHNQFIKKESVMKFLDAFFDFFRQSSKVGCCGYGNLLNMVEEKKAEAKKQSDNK